MIQTPGNRPHVIAVVDTEEEFDWSGPFRRNAFSVEHLLYIGRLQAIFENYKLRPLYAVNSAIATQPRAWEPLKRLRDEGRALIGAHLHPWNTAPFEEELCAHNSYQGNLDRELESAKLATLTRQIVSSFGFHPTVFKAGRYGIGPNTFGLLAELGYRVDLSPAPPLDCSDDGGPDFSRMSCQPFQDPHSGLLVLPQTGAFHGWHPGDHAAAHRWATSSWRRTARVNCILYRSGALRRLWLNPECVKSSDMIALTRQLFANGTRLLILSLHSPVVLPGATPYASDEHGVAAVLKNLERYLEFFFNEFGGLPWTPEEALAHAALQPDLTLSTGTREKN